MTMTIRQLTVALTALLIFTTLPARAGDQRKIATVDMQTLFKEYHRTNEAQKQINVERAKIQKENNDRLSRIRELEKTLQMLRGKLENPAISDKKKKDLFKDFETKTEEGVALDRERREFLQRRNANLNEKMLERMRGILEEIRKLVETRGKAKGYNLLLDNSGLSTSQVPFLLYSDLPDLTVELLSELNKDAPSAE